MDIHHFGPGFDTNFYGAFELKEETIQVIFELNILSIISNYHIAPIGEMKLNTLVSFTVSLTLLRSPQLYLKFEWIVPFKANQKSEKNIFRDSCKHFFNKFCKIFCYTFIPFVRHGLKYKVMSNPSSFPFPFQSGGCNSFILH